MSDDNSYRAFMDAQAMTEFGVDLGTLYQTNATQASRIVREAMLHCFPQLRKEGLR